jgi:hypothetical protein
MHYSILVFESAGGFALRSDAEASGEYWSGVQHYLQALRASGVFVGGAGLEPPQQAKSVRVEAARHVVQDGPYADVKEQLGGLFIVDVPSIDEALDWARRFPHRPGQIVEVRPNLREDSK